MSGGINEQGGSQNHRHGRFDGFYAEFVFTQSLFYWQRGLLSGHSSRISARVVSPKVLISASIDRLILVCRGQRLVPWFSSFRGHSLIGLIGSIALMTSRRVRESDYLAKLNPPRSPLCEFKIPARPRLCSTLER